MKFLNRFFSTIADALLTAVFSLYRRGLDIIITEALLDFATDVATKRVGFFREPTNPTARRRVPIIIII